MKRIPILIVFFVSIVFCVAQNRKHDSLWIVYNDKTKSDTTRLKAIHAIANIYSNNNIDTSLFFAKQELQLAQATNQKKYVGKAFNITGICYANKGNYPKALQYYFKALKVFEEMSDKKWVGNCCNNIGIIYEDQANYPKALNYLLKALKINEEFKDKNGVGISYSNIGSVYYMQLNYAKALDCFLKAIELLGGTDHRYEVANCYSNIGSIYYSQSDYPKSMKYYLKTLKIREEIGDKRGLAQSYNNIGAIYINQANYPRALSNYLNALQITKETGDKEGLAHCYYIMGNLYARLKEYKLAIVNDNLSLKICNEIGDIEKLRRVNEELSEVYALMGNYKEAYAFHVKFKQLTDSIFNAENSKQLGDLRTNFEVQKKELELRAKANAQEAISKEQKKRQQYIIYSVVGLLLVVMVFAVFMFNRFKVTQKQKALIERQKGIVDEQKELVEEKQKEIVDSITYAKRLQRAILPSHEEIKKYLPDSFIYYKPKDIVAGDFYWMENIDDITYIAAADSTGHGVPGAMVSVVCSNALNRAVKEFGQRETGAILDKTRELVLETFTKSGEEIKDGMDISLLAIHKKKEQIEWSGANNQLWYISNNVIFEIKPDKQPIGKTDNPSSFATHNIELKHGDIFYLMTDGYADQFGGSKGKKFKYKQLEDLLLKSSNKDLNEQKLILENSLDEWKGGLEQVDDVCIIGIRL